MTISECLTPDEQQAMQNELNGRCGDCRWWNEHFDDDWGQCARDAFGSYEPMKRPSCLSTHPRFGCIQWKAKEVR